MSESEIGMSGCTDKFDNDGDLRVDCNDEECAETVLCRVPAPAMSPMNGIVSAVLMLFAGVAMLWTRRRVRS
jgi:hypothetical protein